MNELLLKIKRIISCLCVRPLSRHVIQMFLKLAVSNSGYVLAFILDLTILFSTKLIETGGEIVLVFIYPLM